MLPPLADVYIRVMHVKSPKKKSKLMFRFGFNTGFVASGVLRFTRLEIDDACKDKKNRFGKDFFMDLTFEDVEVDAARMGDFSDISTISAATMNALNSRRVASC